MMTPPVRLVSAGATLVRTKANMKQSAMDERIIS
jgi:hypothetical protein